MILNSPKKKFFQQKTNKNNKMNLSEIKSILSTTTSVGFELENGTTVPAHFHITEVGLVTKHFIDCGGTERIEKVVNFQLWNANDTDHRLEPEKLLTIIALSEKKLGIGNLDVEVEYQNGTIGKYGLAHNGQRFVLTNKQTNCLALDACGVPPAKQRLSLAELANVSTNACTPGGGCC